MFKNGFYECTSPPDGLPPPQLCKYPEPKHPVKLLFLGWNPPKPFGGFWSVKYEDNLRSSLHEILKKLGQITAPSPDCYFLEEFKEKGFYVTHTVKCWTESKFPGFGRDLKTSAGRNERKERKEFGSQLISCCVHTRLDKELKELAPKKVCAFGEVSFVGLRKLFPKLPPKSKAKPTKGPNFQSGEEYGIPWPLLYTCLPLGTKLRNIALGHIRRFLQSP